MKKLENIKRGRKILMNHILVLRTIKKNNNILLINTILSNFLVEKCQKFIKKFIRNDFKQLFVHTYFYSFIYFL